MYKSFLLVALIFISTKITAQFVGDFMPWNFKKEIREILNSAREKGIKYIEFNTREQYSHETDTTTVINKLQYYITSDSTLELVSYNNRSNYCVCYHAELKSFLGIYGHVRYNTIYCLGDTSCIESTVLKLPNEKNAQFVLETQVDTTKLYVLEFDKYYDRHDTDLFYFDSNRRLIGKKEMNYYEFFPDEKTIIAIYLSENYRREERSVIIFDTIASNQYLQRFTTQYNEEYNGRKKYHNHYDSYFVARYTMSRDGLPEEIEVIDGDDLDKPKGAKMKILYKKEFPEIEKR